MHDAGSGNGSSSEKTRELHQRPLCETHYRMAKLASESFSSSTAIG
jgi:hypothetical protein